MNSHSYSTRHGLSVCVLCGMVKNKDRKTACRGSLPPVAPRSDALGGAVTSTAPVMTYEVRGGGEGVIISEGWEVER